MDARGIRGTSTYNDAGELTKRQYTSDLTTTLSYDAAGNPLQIKDAAGTWDYQHDALNRLTSVSDPMSKRVTSTYNGAGERTQMATPAGSFQYQYEGVGRLWTIVNPEGERTTYSYDSVGRQTKRQLGNSSSRHGLRRGRTGDEPHQQDLARPVR